MALGDATINGKEINWYPINAGSAGVVRELAADMGVVFDQTVAFVRRRLLAPYGIITFQQTLNPLSRTHALASSAGMTFSPTLDPLTKRQSLETEGDVEIKQAAAVDVLPAMSARQVIEFVFECAIENAFFGHWFDGLRMNLPSENRLMMVPPENRTMSVPPDDDELVPQKDREGVA